MPIKYIALTAIILVALLLYSVKQSPDNLRTITRVSPSSYQLVTANGTMFTVTAAPGELSLNTLTVMQNNVSEPILNIQAEPVENILLADIDDNGTDEIYIISRSTGTGEYAQLTAITKCSNGFQQIAVTHAGTDGSASHSYGGHDVIWIENNMLYWQFPLYSEDDSNAYPSAGDQTQRYQLTEASGDCSLIIAEITKHERIGND